MSSILQIRVSIPEFSDGVSFTDPIILENAADITLAKAVNSSDESISFTLPLTDPKLSYVTSLRWWECWDTVTNQRLNYGPLQDFGRAGGEAKSFGGPGRSALFLDYYKTIQTFYYPINLFLDDMRYENLSSEPRTNTKINQATESPYYGLSKRTQGYAIDEQTGYISIGRDSPERGTIKSDVFWSGTSKSDHLTVDFGEKYKIQKVRVLLPWWGGVTVNNNRAYDWFIGYSDDDSSYTSVYSTPTPNHTIMNPATYGTTVYVGDETKGFEWDQVTISGVAPIDARYWRLNIHDVHAWYGNFYNSPSISDEYGWECQQSNIFKGETLESPTVSGGIMIPTDKLSPASDCHASAVELAFLKRIIGRDTISNLSYKQIENDNRQITFFHQVDNGTELISAGSLKKYEPGGFFRKILVNNPGEVKDEYNAVLYNGSGGPISIDLPAYTRMLTFSNGSVSIDNVDTWKSEVDAFSYGGSYQYTTKAGDWMVLHFRGVSVKWIATIPDTATAAHVSIELRAKDAAGIWGAWSTLESDFTLPVDISGQKVWEITYESNILQDETVYELRITNLNEGGFCAIDAFAGYWSASFKEMNEDDSRWGFRNPQEAIQFYDGRYSLGSAYQYKPTAPSGTKQGISFTGDRVILYSRKFSPLYGKMLIGIITDPAEGTPEKVIIPGGESDGRLLVDLSSPYNITQAIVFDSNDYFTDPYDGLPWGNYRIIVYKYDDESKIWVDGVGIHETEGLSVKFINSTYLDVIKSTAEALQLEWDVTETGLKVVPRIGTDTDIIFSEGQGTTIKIDDKEDAKEVATQLLSSGADIDGIPMSTIVEDKVTRKLVGRTIQRVYDLRNVGDYFTLIGASRAELLRRRTPKKAVTITQIGTLQVNLGDSFMVKTPEIDERMRVTKITRKQSTSSGTEYELECSVWPPII